MSAVPLPDASAGDGAGARTRRSLLAGVAFSLAAVIAVSRANAQASGAPLTLSGHIARQSISGETPLAREMVTLHRVSASSAGPVDSVRTDRAGRYTFHIDADSGAMYIASARYGGIAYFASPARAGDAPAAAEITVFDTTSSDVPLRVQGRHLVVSAPNASGERTIVDVLEIENDTIFTRVAGAANRPTFTVPLPAAARNARVTQGDVSAEAVHVSGGRADVFAPLAPGLRQLVLSYDVPIGAFPLRVLLDRSVGVLEVLLEELNGAASGAKLASQGEVAVEGRNFVRLLARDVGANEVVTITTPAAAPPSSPSPPPWLLWTVLATVSLGGMLIVVRRSSPTPEVTATEPGAGGGGRDDAPALARAAASVDALLEGAEAIGAQRDGLLRYRETLKARLAAVLADRAGAP